MHSTAIQEELSLAYLHAVASKAGFACEQHARPMDSAGRDATIHVVERLTSDSLLTEFRIEVQLKATTRADRFRDGRRSFDLPVLDYERLRQTTLQATHILVVLFQPVAAADWLEHTTEQLILRNCAWWACLRGAPSTTNAETVVVHLPDSQPFSPEGLRELAVRISHDEEIQHAAP